MSSSHEEKMLRAKEIYCTRTQEWTIGRIITFAFFNVIVLVGFWVLFIGKLVKDGLHDYFEHLTNWNWTLDAVFFLLDTLAKLYGLSTRDISDNDFERNFLGLYVTGFLFWFVWGAATLVMILSRMLIADNPSIITELESQFDLGFLLDMDFVLHILPFLILGAYIVFQWNLIGWTLRVLVYRGSYDRCGLGGWSYEVFLIFFSPLFLLGAYVAVFDPVTIYGLTSPTGVYAAVSVGLQILVSSGTYHFLRYMHVH